jgi:murein L,D-transpeptidase YafK
MWSTIFFAMLVLADVEAPAEQDDNPCQDLGTSIVVLTDDHRLWLCDDGSPTKSFKVSLGTGGVGKHTAGDSRTPLGSYRLGQPNRSTQYYLAIAVGYPTAEQARQGFTGKGIAIHGPLRLHRKANGPQTKLDWTRGCIALGTDMAIAIVANWVKEKRPKQVHIF